VWVGVWFSFRLYYPFSKGPGQHIILCLKNKKCENEEPPIHTHTELCQTNRMGLPHNSVHFQKDQQGLPTTTSSGPGGVLLAIKQDTFAVIQKTHFEQDQYQVATWTLKSGIFIPHIHITGMYISPNPLLPHSEIKIYTRRSSRTSTCHPPNPHNIHMVVITTSTLGASIVEQELLSKII